MNKAAGVAVRSCRQLGHTIMYSQVTSSFAVMAVLTVSMVEAQELTWEPVPQLGIREAHCMSYDPVRDRVVLFGGTYCDPIYPCRNDTWEWDGHRWMERHPRTRPLGRAHARMAYDYVRNTTILFGGDTFDGRTPGSGTVNDMWEWDGQDWYQIQVPVLPPYRMAHGMASDPVRRHIVVFGGVAAGALAQGDQWEWDGFRWTQIHSTTMPSLRAACRMAWCGSRGKIMLHGGGIGYYYSTDTCWEWDGTTWSQYVGPDPGRRRGSSMCELPWSGNVLLHGGLHHNGVTEEYEVDTWEWGAQGWRNVNPVHYPAARFPPEIAQHGGSQAVVLYGEFGIAGQLPGTDPNDREDATWLFQQSDWSRLIGVNEVPGPAPQGADFYTAAQDGPRDRQVAMMLHPGRPGTQDPFTWDTYLIEEDSYRLAVPAAQSPPFRFDCSICTHEGLGIVVMFGGQVGLRRDDTWVWNGASWTQDTRPNHPPAGNYGRAVYDPDRQVVVLVQRNNNRVYEYGAQGWSERVEAQLPFAGQTAFLLGYDAGRHRLVYAGIANNTAGDFETWEFANGAWHQCYPQNPAPYWPMGSGFYAEWLGGCVWSGGSSNPGGLVLYDGVDWRMLTPSRALADARLSGFGPLTLCADPRRQRLRAVISSLCWNLPSASITWDLYLRTLKVWPTHPRLGQQVRLDVQLPRYANNVAALLFSHDTWPGIALGNGPSDLVLPLADGGVLRASLGAIQLVLTDSQGRGAATLTIPNNGALVGLQLSAAGFTLDAALRGIGTTTNPVTFDVIR